jgi:outer membrane immunogenic protein
LEKEMRRLGCGLLLACALTPAAAADYETPWLRGSTTDLPTPAPYRIWSGFYFGGHFGLDFHGTDFSGVPFNSIASIMTQDAILAQLPVIQMPVMPSQVKSSWNAGGFLGYNYQMDDIVLGMEANYSQTRLSAAVVDTQSRNYFVNFNSHIFATTINTQVTAAASYNQLGDFRARAAWAFGNFLPYAFVGAALAQVNSYQYTNVRYLGVDVTPQSGGSPGFLPNIGANYTEGAASTGKYVLGFSAGVGLDYAILDNIFLRGEAEYLQLGQPNGIKLNDVSMRAGAGVKF